MDLTGFAIFCALAAAVTVVSLGLDVLYARILPFRFLYYAIRMPGIALHEISHVTGCLVTGAAVKKVVLFSKEGGSVTYAEPKIPLLGNVVISTAPLILMPLFLALLTEVFPLLSAGSSVSGLPSAGAGIALYELAASVAGLFAANLFSRFNGWFLLYLYLCVSVILSLAPSRQDFSNAAAGIVIVVSACVLVMVSGHTPAISLLSQAVDLMTYPFLLGLFFEMIAAAVSLPLALAYGIFKKAG